MTPPLELGYSPCPNDTFLFYGLTSVRDEAPAKRIHVDRGQVQRLVASFERTWSRPPTPEEEVIMRDLHSRLYALRENGRNKES